MKYLTNLGCRLPHPGLTLQASRACAAEDAQYLPASARPNSVNYELAQPDILSRRSDAVP